MTGQRGEGRGDKGCKGVERWLVLSCMIMT